MSMLKRYEDIKDALNGLQQDSIELKNSINLIVSIMESWLETYEYTKDFDCLMNVIKKDYTYSGILYRGITLSKNEVNWRERINFSTIQSFSKDKKVAINFSTNNMVTEDEDINIIKDSNEVIPILIEFKDENIGIDLDKFSSDLVYICKNLIDNKEEAEDFEELLTYAIEEREVLVYPNDLLNKHNINMYEI